MSNTCDNAKIFLTEILDGAGFDLAVESRMDDEGCHLNMSGDDAHFLLNESGELLDALETILFQVYGKELDRSHRIICDAEGFRQTRKNELFAMAQFAAQNVRKSGRAFTFGKLNSTERRIIHMALVNEEDLESESVGEGRERRLQVRLK
jgi:spoIIIJ-associated protein